MCERVEVVLVWYCVLFDEYLVLVIIIDEIGVIGEVNSVVSCLFGWFVFGCDIKDVFGVGFDELFDGCWFVLTLWVLLGEMCCFVLIVYCVVVDGCAELV